MIKTMLKWIGDSITIVLVFIIGVSVFTMFQAKTNPQKVPSVFGFKPLKVLTGSMEPVLKPGDMVVTRETEPEEIQIGDVLTYRIEGNTLVTHRVIGIVEENGIVKFRTKGDANNTEDQELIEGKQAIGTMAFKIPGGGMIADFAKTGRGFLLFILLPIFLLIVSELRVIWLELKKVNNKKTEAPDHIKA
ncbi:signal peptidase I [Geosporobacter ferrireducens]|uniref:Signal peptidase I n=1 Tax=Geosporobacter ferrireducens TaxID=1424294 RepID=A0A1D8GGZ7_9FIRM|nr:signal peptidase I [Geosporobacter ferrireducens]AOT70185.1 signal peptidase I [Geosporobacter ferrireducens]MTI53268.1 signal peptidase I [Geosporobacter ferrireducens]